MTIDKYHLKLNPEKYVFRLRVGKFLGFLLTVRGIEENLDKFPTIINMRIPTNLKEVQRLTVLHELEKRYKKTKKAALAVIVMARRLRLYFQSFSIVIKIVLPIRQVLRKPNVAMRMMKWVVELSEFNIKYEPKAPLKAQVLTDFIVELTAPYPPESLIESIWILSVDGAFNLKGSGAGVILERPNGILIEQFV